MSIENFGEKLKAYILDENDNPVIAKTREEWVSFMESVPNRRFIKMDIFQDELVKVSTVFLGLDYSFGQGKKDLFETMIFGGEHNGYMDRYETKAEALEGHERAVRLVKNLDEVKEN